MDDLNNNEKSPAQIEKEKTKKQRAEDVAYTLNNAIVCTVADSFAPFIGHSIQKKLSNTSKSQYGKWYIAELAGDYAAIPPTIAMQRHFPGVMASISKTVEPLFKKSLSKGAERSTKEWAERHGVSRDSEDYQKHFDKVYKYEITHVPQALVWAASATALNVGLQLAMDKEKTPVSHILAGKIGGAAFAAGITLAGRTVFPNKAEKLDNYISKHFVLPAGEVEEKLEKLAGHHDKDDHHGKKDDSWKERVKINGADKAPEIRI